MADIIKTGAAGVYERIENPLQAIQELGKAMHQSAMLGVTTPGDGQVLALTCMCEGITPLEFARTYHIVDGKPTMRADAMHAQFRQAGGKVEWRETGDDGKRASAAFSFGGQTLELSFTIDDAARMVGDKLKKAGSNWQKDPGAMLRARLISKALRMIAPEIVAGVYTPDEIESTQPEKPAGRTPEQIAQRQAELQQMQQAAPEQPVIDIEPEPVESVEPANETPQATAQAATLISKEQLQIVYRLGMQLRKPDGQTLTVEEIAAQINKSCNVDHPAYATAEQIDGIIERMQAALAKQGGA